MIDKKNIKDIALVALMQYHGFAHEKQKDGSFRICISDKEFTAILKRYQLELRPILQRIKRLQ